MCLPSSECSRLIERHGRGRNLSFLMTEAVRGNGRVEDMDLEIFSSLSLVGPLCGAAAGVLSPWLWRAAWRPEMAPDECCFGKTSQPSSSLLVSCRGPLSRKGLRLQGDWTAAN